ncbi:DUF721 domain-containing protein [Desulfonatronum lacustre]|uniref:DUF721 domain-containing protein n=1 Tax=Desulfonatronum lacustre TaxID=66849 RepID=UPI0004AE76BC|nr:DUF721 domain-containing protein [Desulfonatronum lacustre]
MFCGLFDMTYQARDILHDFWNRAERRFQWRLAEIWSSWPIVVGPEIADMAKPLGRNKTTLLLGVEDPMVMQEMHFHAPTILRAVNAALGEKVFDKVRLDLLGGRSSLVAVADAMGTALREGKKTASRFSPEIYVQAGVRLEGTNHPVKRFSAVPALERCYRKYVRSLEQVKSRNKSEPCAATTNRVDDRPE